MKVYYIAWCGVPCAEYALHRVKYATLNFTIEEVEIEGVGD